MIDIPVLASSIFRLYKAEPCWIGVASASSGLTLLLSEQTHSTVLVSGSRMHYWKYYILRGCVDSGLIVLAASHHALSLQQVVSELGTLPRIQAGYLLPAMCPK